VCCRVLQCVAVCCSVLYCAAECSPFLLCSVLQYVAVCCSVSRCNYACQYLSVQRTSKTLPPFLPHRRHVSKQQCSSRKEPSRCVAVCHSVLQSVAVWCSVLQCVAVCCSVLQCAVVCCTAKQCVAMCCIGCSENRPPLRVRKNGESKEYVFNI